MVAEAPSLPAIKAEAKSNLGKRFRIPIALRSKARVLYLHKGFDYKTIATETGLDVRTLQNLASREGWTKRRAENQLAVDRAVDMRLDSTQTDLGTALADESDEIAYKLIGRTREAAESKDKFAARDAQSWSGAARNLVQVARAIREPMSAQIGANGAAGLSVFILRVGDASASTPNGVEQAKQVTEIEAKQIAPS